MNDKSAEIFLLKEIFILLDKFDKKTLQALKEILILLANVDKKPLHALTEILATEDPIETLRRSVTKESTMPSSTHSSGAQYKQLDTISMIANLEKTDIEKYKMLEHILRFLNDKTFLPTVKEIKLFSEKNSLPKITARSRARAIHEFIGFLLEFSHEDIKNYISLLEEQAGSKDRSLHRWSSIIVNTDNSVSPHDSPS